MSKCPASSSQARKIEKPLRYYYGCFIMAFLWISSSYAQEVTPAVQGGKTSQRHLVESDCIAPFEYIPYLKPKWAKDDVQYNAQGYYQRISPDGRFVIRSLSGAGMGSVSLLEMKQDSAGDLGAVAYRTPLSNEAFALLSTFRFVVDVDGRHYKIKDIIEDGKKAKSHFKAGETGVYAASTELAGGTEAKFKIRSIAWPNAGASDDSRGTGSLTMRESLVEKDAKGQYRRVEENSFQLCRNLYKKDTSPDGKAEGRIFTTPMISVNGEEVAARPIDPDDGKSSLRIYRIKENGNCLKVADLGVEAEKVIFGASEEGKPAPILWVDLSGLHYWDREINENLYLQNPNKPFSSKGYPALLKDGRIMTAAVWDECKEIKSKRVCQEVSGFVRVDPFQSQDFDKYRKNNPESSKAKVACISKKRVQEVELHQAKIYELEPLENSIESTKQKESENASPATSGGQGVD